MFPDFVAKFAVCSIFLARSKRHGPGGGGREGLAVLHIVVSIIGLARIPYQTPGDRCVPSLSSPDCNTTYEQQVHEEHSSMYGTHYMTS